MPDAIRLAVLGTGHRASGGSAPPAEVAAVAAAGFRPELVETRRGVFPANLVDHALAGLCNLDAGIEAERAGYRGLLLNTFGDYGIDALRSALSIPVVGAGEAALAVARTLGRRLAIVTIWPRSLGFIYDERLKACDAEGACADIIHVLDEAEMAPVLAGGDDDAVSRMRDGHADTVDRVVAAAERAVRDLGAEVVVLGCTCMAPIGGWVAGRLTVPVVEPLTAAYKYLELLAGLGLSQSRAAYAPAPAASLARVGPAVLGLPAAQIECEPCAATQGE